MDEQPLQVSRFEESERIPLSARLLLWWAKKRRRSGLLFHCAMRDSFRSVTLKWSIVSIECEGETLCEMTNTTIKRPMFIDLPPGRRELAFRVIRARKKMGTLFKEEVNLREGEIFIALCEPIQPNVFYRKSPAKDTWKVGQVGTVTRE
ncbi:hypothetical protein OG810_35745 [Streptomyces sp. NBC_01693]|uniref:hypothetical protein n=1 Tax=Streptomyces sp. NBC_01693 TaxID=2975912 RepID=UPI002E36DBF6|nr:hypothetical protein [Streptomyces sp. NBC_01693]